MSNVIGSSSEDEENDIEDDQVGIMNGLGRAPKKSSRGFA